MRFCIVLIKGITVPPVVQTFLGLNPVAGRFYGLFAAMRGDLSDAGADAPAITLSRGTVTILVAGAAPASYKV